MAKIEVEEKKLSDFRTQEENANAHTERGLQALGEAYSEVGYIFGVTGGYGIVRHFPVGGTCVGCVKLKF